MTEPLEPLTLTVIQAGLQQVCDEMDLVFSRAAFSPIISEADDRSDGIYSAEDGALIAQGLRGLPLFTGTMQSSTAHIIRLIREGKVAHPVPGDVYAVNDPYLGGTHLMDVRFATPFWRDGQIFCWLSNVGHWPDVGGAVPGGFSASATEIEQEGLRFPPIKLFKSGELDRELLSVITSNIRVPEQRIGDIAAQAAALRVGAERLSELLDRHGDAKVARAIGEVRERAARQMKAMIATIAEGIYTASAYIDSDGIEPDPLEIRLTVQRTTDGRLVFDFSGSSLPCRGPMNCVEATTQSSVYLALRHVFPDVPLNAGAFEPVEIVGIAGTFLDARYPRPVSGCAAEVSQRIAEAVFLALVQAVPERVTAAPAGTSGNFVLGGNDPLTGRDYVLYQITGGGYGGFVGGDGISNGCSTIGISKSPPVEITELTFPVLFREYALAEGSGGAGEFRGGFGLRYVLEVLRGEATASFVMDHNRFGPPGVRSGADGQPGEILVHRQGRRVHTPPHLSKEQGLALRSGDFVEVRTPGGGGYGLAFDRDVEAIARDVALGYFTPEQAAERFGVALDASGHVDEASTRALRTRAAVRVHRN